MESFVQVYAYGSDLKKAIKIPDQTIGSHALLNTLIKFRKAQNRRKRFRLPIRRSASLVGIK
jgi:hypothetical protein